MSDWQTEISRYEHRLDEDLYVSLEIEMNATLNSLNANDIDPDRKQTLSEKGRLRFQSLKNQFQKTLCQNQTIQSLILDERTKNRNELIAILCDVLSVKFTGVPVVICATLLTREGLHQLCNFDEESKMR